MYVQSKKKTQIKLKHFTFNLKVSFCCNHKRVRTQTFASVHVYKIMIRKKLKYNTNYNKGLKMNKNLNCNKKFLNSTQDNTFTITKRNIN